MTEMSRNLSNQIKIVEVEVATELELNIQQQQWFKTNYKYFKYIEMEKWL